MTQISLVNQLACLVKTCPKCHFLCSCAPVDSLWLWCLCLGNRGDHSVCGGGGGQSHTPNQKVPGNEVGEEYFSTNYFSIHQHCCEIFVPTISNQPTGKSCEFLTYTLFLPVRYKLSFNREGLPEWEICITTHQY